MTEAPSWQDEARRLLAGGMSIKNVARAVRRGESTLRIALDINGTGAQTAKSYQAKRSQARAELVGLRRRGEASKTYTDRDEQRSVVRAYADAPAARPLTLPRVSIPSLPDEDLRSIRFAPRTRIRPVSSGAERWRQIHRLMIRAGKLSEPGLPEQLHH